MMIDDDDDDGARSSVVVCVCGLVSWLFGNEVTESCVGTNSKY